LAIVKVKPAGEGGVAFMAVAVDRAVGPAAEHGSDEPFGLAVRIRRQLRLIRLLRSELFV
jgi:hypothetical protein